MWILAFAVAQAGTPSPGLRALSGAGIVTGAAGAALAGASLAFVGSPEPYGLMLMWPPGMALLGAGTGLALTGTWLQAERLDVPPVAAAVGLGLVGGAVAVAAVGAAVGDDAGAWTFFAGTPLTTAGALGAAVVQGANNRHGSDARVMLAPHPRHAGLVVLGSF